MVKEFTFLQMEKNTKVKLLMVRKKDMVFIIILMEISMKDYGLMIKRMVMEYTNLLKEMKHIQVYLMMVFSMEKEHMNLLMETCKKLNK